MEGGTAGTRNTAREKQKATMLEQQTHTVKDVLQKGTVTARHPVRWYLKS
jgi:hypothetical protein